jgi:hypothetical protein
MQPFALLSPREDPGRVGIDLGEKWIDASAGFDVVVAPPALVAVVAPRPCAGRALSPPRAAGERAGGGVSSRGHELLRFFEHGCNGTACGGKPLCEATFGVVAGTSLKSRADWILHARDETRAAVLHPGEARNSLGMRFPAMELGGLEPPTSWVRSRRALALSLACLQGFAAVEARPEARISGPLRPFRLGSGQRNVSLARSCVL